jgi:hypothetical protein
VKLNRDSWFVFWLYVLREDIPRQTTLCALFWQMVGMGMLTLGLLAWAVMASVLVYFYFWTVLWVVGVVVGPLMGIGGLFMLMDWVRETPSKAGQVMRAMKSRFCPIIELVGEDEDER